MNDVLPWWSQRVKWTWTLAALSRDYRQGKPLKVR